VNNPVTGRCEKIDFKTCSELDVKKLALGCPISDRWGVGKHLGSKIKSRKLKQINFFTSSGHLVSEAMW
jgi:nucleotidyltransferase/DNA polymerase involved in DNA repair